MYFLVLLTADLFKLLLKLELKLLRALNGHCRHALELSTELVGLAGRQCQLPQNASMRQFSMIADYGGMRGAGIPLCRVEPRRSQATRS